MYKHSEKDLFGGLLAENFCTQYSLYQIVYIYRRIQSKYEGGGEPFNVWATKNFSEICDESPLANSARDFPRNKRISRDFKIKQ